MAEQLTVSELYTRLSVPVKGAESHTQYMSFSKSKQDSLKDTGGFIGGELLNNTRKAGHILSRSLITLDLDNIPSGETEKILIKLSTLGIGLCVYSTRKHSPEAPRLRIVIPTYRDMTADEYVPASRKIAQIIDPTMTLFDKTTFEVGRIMYWPSVSSDVSFVFKYVDAALTDVDGLLKLYTDWRDFNEWPLCPSEASMHAAPNTKQTDPLTKNGVIGAFCKTYSISAAIQKFLPDIYVPAGDSRYTYAKGSTVGGAVVYEDKYIFSHHATDPAGGVLCNAFDMVRIHLFGSLDDSAKDGTPTHKLPSFAKMREYAMGDSAVNMLMRTERAAEVYEDFKDIADTNGMAVADKGAAENKLAWMRALDFDDNTGKYIKSASNVLNILNMDPMLKDRFFQNVFASRSLAVAPLPWGSRQSETGPFEWTDADTSGLLVYIERMIDIHNKSLIENALSECWAQHQWHPVKSYFSGLQWDGLPRLEHIFQTYLGAEDTEYVRAVAKITFAAAVTRIYNPGFYFDTCPVLVGPQGLGKSKFISIMAKCSDWFTDNLNDLSDKQSIENIQGVLLAELGEMAAMNKTELNAAKQFITRTHDRVRPAYGHYSVNFPRSCVFIGTTNTSAFLKDPTGERRFLPIDCGVNPPERSVIYDLASEVDQIWAEAIYYYNARLPLVLPDNLRGAAIAAQSAHSIRSEKIGLIEEFLERPIPADWDMYPIDRRLCFLADTATKYEGLVARSSVCAAEIWVECFGNKLSYMRNSDSQFINDILRGMKNWQETRGPRKFAQYGNQRGFIRNVI